MRAVPLCPVIERWTGMPSTDAAELAAREGHRGIHRRGGKLRRAVAGFDRKQRRAAGRRAQPAVVSATSPDDERVVPTGGTAQAEREQTAYEKCWRCIART